MEQEKRIAVVIDPHLVERNPRCRKDNFFETALGKLEYLAQNNDYVVIAGDLFHIHSNSTWFFNVVYSLFKKYQGKFHAIPGNHDVFHRNLSALDKTTLGSLYYTDVLLLHTTPWTLAGVEFVPVLINTDVNDIPVDETNTKVLIGHKFYEQNFDPEESLFADDIRRLNYNLVFLGHDHKPYSEDFIGNSSLIRMGSLTRIDTQYYNKDREILYYQITTSGNGEYDYTQKVVPHKPAKEVYSEEAYNSMGVKDTKEREVVSFVQIGDVLAKLTKTTKGINSLDRTLRSLKAPEASIADIKWRHELNNVSYT